MRTTGVAMLVALLAGGAWAQPGSTPAIKLPQMSVPDVAVPSADKEANDSNKVPQLRTRSDKLKAENDKIDRQMQEARDKADAAMGAANADLAIGVVAGALQIGASGSSQTGAASARPCKDCVANAKH